MPAQPLVGTPVFIALTTTELKGEGELVRLLAQHPAQAKAFDRLIRANRLTLAQSRTIGITNAQLDRAPDLDEVLQDLIDYCEGGEALIAGQGPQAREALGSAGRKSGILRLPLPKVIGLDEVSAIVLPTLGRRTLFDMRQHYRQKASLLKDGANATPDSPADQEDPAEPEPQEQLLLLAELWNWLAHDLLKLPLPLLAEMNWLIHKTDHPLKAILQQAEKLAVSDQFADTFTTGKLSLEKLFKDHSEIIKCLAPDDNPAVEPPASAPQEPVTAGEVAQLLGPGGPLAKGLAGYEDRPEQIEMGQRVAEALTDGRHLLVEAGTGVGKSLAYLLPALLFARRARRALIISTHTKNLQSQLFNKDIPLLQKNLGIEFSAAVLKGRSNYICLRKLMYTLQEAPHELDDPQRGKLLPLMAWATQTDSGDIAEVSAFAAEQDYELWDHLHTIGEDCLGRQCPFYNRCFLYKARGLARTADLVVVNHALVFAELSLEAGTLPPYNEMVFDEAHKLEEFATDHLATEVSPRMVYRHLHRLFRAGHGQAAGKGILPTLLAYLEQSRTQFGESLFESIREHVLTAIQAVQPANDGADLYFQILRDWTERVTEPPAEDEVLREFVPPERGRGGVYLERDGDLDSELSPVPLRKVPWRKPKSEERKRYSAQSLHRDEAENFRAGKEAAIAGLGRLRQALAQLEDDFKEIRKRNVPRARELSREVSARNLWLSELIHSIEFVSKADEPNYVYWSERAGRRGARAVAAPLDVSALLHGQLYDRKRSIILTSATLSVRDPEAEGAGLTPYKSKIASGHPAPEGPAKPHPKSFEFLKNRLGLSLCPPEKLDELLLGSPFDYSSQCRLYVPTFIPEPASRREKEYSQALSDLLAELIISSRGRALVLYTAYTALEAGAAQLRKLLSPEGIEVLAQRADGSRESLLARLKAGQRTVLLGTSSFWEGVDVQGQALSLLVITKLPFAVFTDPIIQGRCELLEQQGKDSFLHLSVPTAILRLRQGFGRLIRSKSDRGVVVLADKRVLTKRYGAAFLRALPARAITMTSHEALNDQVRQFLQ